LFQLFTWDNIVSANLNTLITILS